MPIFIANVKKQIDSPSLDSKNLDPFRFTLAFIRAFGFKWCNKDCRYECSRAYSDVMKSNAMKLGLIILVYGENPGVIARTKRGKKKR